MPMGTPTDADADADVTWYADIQPLMDRHCVRCHYDGGLGVDIEALRLSLFAEVMLSRIDSGGYHQSPT